MVISSVLMVGIHIEFFLSWGIGCHFGYKNRSGQNILKGTQNQAHGMNCWVGFHEDHYRVTAENNVKILALL